MVECGPRKNVWFLSGPWVEKGWSTESEQLFFCFHYLFISTRTMHTNTLISEKRRDELCQMMAETRGSFHSVRHLPSNWQFDRNPGSVSASSRWQQQLKLFLFSRVYLLGDGHPRWRGEESFAGGRCAAEEVQRHRALHRPQLPNRGRSGEIHLHWPKEDLPLEHKPKQVCERDGDAERVISVLLQS